MKRLLVLLLFLPALTTRAQTPWPRNPQTGKIEFKGMLPWPASAKTEAQHKALVRRWYLKKLTDQSPQAVEEEARTVVSPTLLTYASLPNSAVIGNANPPNPGILAYIVTLSPNAKGLSYKLTEFGFSRQGEVSSEPNAELERIIAADNPADRPALAALYKRLAVALTGW